MLMSFINISYLLCLHDKVKAHRVNTAFITSSSSSPVSHQQSYSITHLHSSAHISSSPLWSLTLCMLPIIPYLHIIVIIPYLHIIISHLISLLLLPSFSSISLCTIYYRTVTRLSIKHVRMNMRVPYWYCYKIKQTLTFKIRLHLEVW